MQTIKKYRANAVRTAFLVAQHPELTEENFCHKMKILDAEYLRTLYTGNFVKAFPKFCKLSFAYWDWRKLLKETQRMIGVAVLGQRKFLHYKTKGF